MTSRARAEGIWYDGLSGSSYISNFTRQAFLAPESYGDGAPVIYKQIPYASRNLIPGDLETLQGVGMLPLFRLWQYFVRVIIGGLRQDRITKRNSPSARGVLRVLLNWMEIRRRFEYPEYLRRWHANMAKTHYWMQRRISIGHMGWIHMPAGGGTMAEVRPGSNSGVLHHAFQRIIGGVMDWQTPPPPPLGPGF